MTSRNLLNVSFVVNGAAKSAAYIAAQIYQLWVEDAAKHFVEEFFERFIALDSKREPFTFKIRLYCEASVLRILLAEAQTGDQRYAGLVQEFEKLIFPPVRGSEAWNKLEAIKSAMSNLDRLFSDGKHFSWTRSWLAGIGYDETNPETLTLFVQLLGADIKSLRELLGEIGR
jgi:hypothetical protein